MEQQQQVRKRRRQIAFWIEQTHLAAVASLAGPCVCLQFVFDHVREVFGATLKPGKLELWIGATAVRGIVDGIARPGPLGGSHLLGLGVFAEAGDGRRLVGRRGRRPIGRRVGVVIVARIWVR